jgi:acyl-CoA thioesterase-1
MLPDFSTQVVAFLACGFLIIAGVRAQGVGDSVVQPPPFWESSKMDIDPLLFIQPDDDSAPTAKLLFPADANLSITSMDGKQVYELGRDYAWKPGSDTLTLTTNTRIPFKKHHEMFPLPGQPNSYGSTKNGTSVLYAEGPFFYNLHVYATYHHAAKWTGTIPAGPASELERTRAKLQARQPLKIVLLGDSISAGASSSNSFNAEPHRLDYFDRLQTYLRAKFGSNVTGINLSVGGTAAPWGASMVDKVVAEKPDLVIIAFGMNDSEPAPEFLTKIKEIVDPIRVACPKADIILVSPMTGNPDLTAFPPQHFVGYRDALLCLKGPGVAVADVTTIWIDLLKQKTFADLTGNGVNHPNDFGHEVYADVFEKLF